jgi:hypothetical protein
VPEQTRSIFRAPRDCSLKLWLKIKVWGQEALRGPEASLVNTLRNMLRDAARELRIQAEALTDMAEHLQNPITGQVDTNYILQERAHLGPASD